MTVEGTSFSYSYDGDGVLTQAGALQAYAEDDDAARTVTTGRLWKTVLGTVQTVQSYTPYGEVEAFTASTGGTTLFGTALEYDDLGRIVEKHETIGSATTDYEYVYDDAGRLWQVKVGGSVVETYTYDDNGNRVSKDPSVGATLVGVTNDWDQLECYAQNTSPCDGLAYTYTLNGELATRTEVGSGDVMRYSYDALGNLREVELPDGTVITYLIDGLNRRVGKVVDGVLEKRWLYLDGLRIAAEIDVASNVTTRFVYGTRGNIPDYMVRSGTTYRILSDHLGSPRFVVNTSSGAVVRRMEYDVFGQVQDDPGSGIEHGGWIPFGFAGGLYDPDTGLVRFGARDYDPETGRWTAKDPIGFAGGDTNLYGYVFNDPINWIDPTGLEGFFEPMTSEERRHILSSVGKIWTLPNTAVGFVIGMLGNPQVPTTANNALEFRGNRLVGLFTPALTIGNVICYADDNPTRDIQAHERAHTYQAEALGWVYLPFHVLSQVAGLAYSYFDTSHTYVNINDRVHSPANLLEKGPMEYPPRPWWFLD